jgi:polyisoprenoid-binding protein YceI
MANIKWNLDPTHSELQFKVKHLMITNVTGSFADFSVEAESEDEHFNAPVISFAAKVSSINTANEQRDGHLKSVDFFDAEKYPELIFKSLLVKNKDEDGNFELVGDLTIKDVTKQVTLKVEFGGVAKDPWGNVKAGFTVNTKINRTEFGLTWNAPIEAGGVLVSEEVKIAAEIQLIKAIN